MLRESLRGGTSLSVFGMATFSFTILYSIVNLESVRLSDSVLHCNWSSMLLTLEVLQCLPVTYLAARL